MTATETRHCLYQLVNLRPQEIVRMASTKGDPVQPADGVVIPALHGDVGVTSQQLHAQIVTF